MRPKGETEPGVKPRIVDSSWLFAKVRREVRDRERDLRLARWEHSRM